MSQAGEDLFEGTKMSFGQHLEELRVHLFRAVLGLAVGMVISLTVANKIVDQIKYPLQSALEDYYATSSLIDLEAQFATIDKEVPQNLQDFVEQSNFTFEEFYLERAELKRLTREEAESVEPWINSAEDREKLLATQLPTPQADMVKTRLWRPAKGKIVALGAQESFMIWLKAGFMAGLILSSPWIFWQIWQFVATGLYPHERRYVHIYLPFSLGLFIAGATLAFTFVFQPVLQFLFSFNRMMNIDPDPRISEWMGFVLFLPIGFGIAFQLPLVMLFLNRIGVVSIEIFLEKWRIAVLVIFVISMLLTPADPISMLLMAVPLTVLYFFGLLLCKYMPKGQSPFDEAYDPS